MSFTIKLQINKSENEKFSKKLIDVLTLTGTLKNGTSIVDPVILFECDLKQITNCNYMSISEFSRSYFITDMKSIRNGLVEISAHCDVLSSFKDEILTNDAIILRQEKNWNLYVDDGVFTTYQNDEIITKEFPSGFSTQEFVLAVAGGSN